MAILTREWEYRRSTDTVQYSVQHFEHRFRFPDEPTQIQCRGGLFMTVNIAAAADGGGDNRLINCLVSAGYDEEYYYHLQEEEFAAELRSHFPDISGSDASKLTETFTEILHMANAAHCCPECAPAAGGFGTSHNVSFKIQPFLSQRRRRHALPVAAAALVEEFIVDEEVDEEENDELSVRPATRASIVELLKATSSCSGYQGGECGICMEDIETPTKTLRMPCSHSFHRRCLLNWLDNSHSCPLCRYQMPAAQFQSTI